MSFIRQGLYGVFEKFYVFVLVIFFVGLIFIFISNPIPSFAVSLHNRTLDELKKQSNNGEDVAHIEVGKFPTKMVKYLDKLYVLNSDSKSFSVINITSNTKVADIPIRGSPVDIQVDVQNNLAYVTTSLSVVPYHSSSLFVFNADTYKEIANIPVKGDIANELVMSSTLSTIEGTKLNSSVFITNSFSYVTVITRPTNSDADIIYIPVGTDPVGFGGGFGSFLYVANSGSDSVSVISTKNNTKVGSDIPVGKNPSTIVVDETTGTAYVANSGSDSVSVISTKNNTKVGSDIPVGKNPSTIVVDETTGTAYVANSGSDSVSVISTKNNTKVGSDIPVGKNPSTIVVDETTGTAYVANSGSDSVSVISTKNNTKVGSDIPVGKNPSTIVVDETTGTAYVANSGSDSVSVIDIESKKVVAGVTFNVHPFNSGYIQCGDSIVPIDKYFYAYSGSNCMAIPNKGFEFLSWQENLHGNSTQLIKVSPSISVIDSILDIFDTRQFKPESQINISKFGSFTANFIELPSPIPPEYWIPLYGVVISTMVGWSIPGLIGWFQTKTESRRLDKYHQIITSLYDDGKLDENDVNQLDKIRNDIVNSYSKGKINKEHYETMQDEISLLYEELFIKRIESINRDEKVAKEMIKDLENELIKSYSKGQLSELHYNILKEKLSSKNNTI